MSDDPYRRKLAHEEANRQAIIRELEESNEEALLNEAQRQRQMSENIKKNYDTSVHNDSPRVCPGCGKIHG